jgi:hypothetical protein
MAIMEAKLFAAMFLQKFDYVLSPGAVVCGL